MVKCGEKERFTIKDLAERENYPYAYVEKIFQSLRSAGIVTSFQGKQGGYALSKPAAEICLKEIIEALEGQTFDVICEQKSAHEHICNHSGHCALNPIWKQTKDLLDNYFASLSLNDVAKHQNALNLTAATFPMQTNEAMKEF